jgi:DNA-binding NtrC family response regulator
MPDVRAADSVLQQALDDFERSFLLRAVEQTDGTVTAAARALGIALSTLKHKLQRLDIGDAPRRIRRT